MGDFWGAKRAESQEEKSGFALIECCKLAASLAGAVARRCGFALALALALTFTSTRSLACQLDLLDLAPQCRAGRASASSRHAICWPAGRREINIAQLVVGV